MDHKKALVIICAAALLLRIILALQAPALTYEAYSTIRQVDHIKDTGLPLIKDSLQQRTTIPLPVFPYILAFSTLFLPDNLVYALIPNILGVLLHAALFYLILELTNDIRISLFGAAASIFMPAYIEATLLTLSTLSLALPLLIIIITLYLKLRKTREKRNHLLAAFTILSFTSPIALILLPFIILSLIINTINRAKGETAQQEFAIFGIFFLLWFNILLYRKALSELGSRALHANIPAAALAATYSDTTITAIATSIGVIPFGLALYATYKETTREHLGVQTVIGLTAIIAAALALKIIPLGTGLSLFSTTCFALAATGLYHLYRYVKTLNHTFLPRTAALIVAVLFIITSIIPAAIAGIDAINNTADPAVIDAAVWLSDNSLPTATVLAPAAWGSIIEARGHRPVYIDEDYLRMSDAEERYTNAVAVLEDKNVESITEAAHIEYIMSDRRTTSSCVNTIYTKGVFIGKVLCS